MTTPPIVDQAPASLAFDVHRFTLTYKVAGERTSEYVITPEHVGGISPFNSENTPFLLPSNVEDFGGQVAIESASSGPVWWTLTQQFLLNGTPIVNAKGYNVIDSPVTLAVNPGVPGLCGYNPIMQANPWQFKGTDLPSLTPVLMRLGLKAYSDDQHTVVQANESSTEVVNLWVMRAAG